ncbi:response regulator [Pseudotabrizicola sediminis]|uniref:histidine kinase n=1 Tax=Pseudotabrizicola sediminis TaxID=2486418 RepID=A0ABY2KMY9_9RHOB|nr:response regulator [Pseudotabrizicola sediminis]TGD43955.1 response regulator [Pseudotabrizicola sediminis]
MKVAVVEDNSVIRAVLVAAMDGFAGSVVTEFCAVGPLLEACRDTLFDAIILDYQLPDQTGVDATRSLRADPRFKHVPIIMVTADSDSALRLEAIRSGATDFLTKPVNIEELRLRVGNLLALRQAQLDVLAREKLLNAVIESSTASIVIGDASRPDIPMIYANGAFERLSGFTRDEVLGRNCRLLAMEAPDHPVRMQLRRAVAARAAGTFRLRNRRRNGEVFWNQIDLHPVPGSGDEARFIVATQTDVTAEVEASRTRDRLGARLSDIAQLSDAWFFEFDRTLCISYLSPAMAKALDIAPEQVQGLSVDVFADRIAVDSEGTGSDLRSLLSRRQPVDRLRLRLKRPDGTSRWLQTSTTTFFTAEGAFDGVRGFASDISDLIEARDTARQAARTQAAFVAMMSHELRTPLTAIIGLTDLLEGSDLSSAVRADLATIRSSAQALTWVLNDVLDHSQLEGGQLKLAIAEFDLTHLLAGLIQWHSPAARARGLSLRLEVEGEGPPHRRGDPDRLRQILRNLIDNSLRFTPKGSVTVMLMLRGDSSITLRIADTGVGIAPEDTDRIFDPFVQLDASMGRLHSGRGLGLTLARKLAEAMGGTLSVRSQPGAGSVFVLDLPLPGVALAVAPRPLSLKGMPVLVADDNRANRKLLEIMLSRLGAKVTLAEDGHAAVQAWAPGRFELLLLDINMPGLTGTDVIARIRAQEGHAGLAPVPALAVSANARPEQVADYLAAGFDGCIAKPFTLAALHTALSMPGLSHITI